VITEEEYWRGPDSVRRDVAYADDVTDEIRTNATKTVAMINPLLQEYAEETGVVLEEVASGWRPPAVNDATKNAAKGTSTHLTAKAGDIKDKTHKFQVWCFKNQQKLEAHGLYMEHPIATPTWAHLQWTPPKSGDRVYYPTVQAKKDWEAYLISNPDGGRYA